VVATATSVGLTVRVLSDTQRLNTPEGATIMSAAVIDDVIGLVFLSLLVGMGAGASGVSIPWAAIGLFSIRAAVVFFGLLFTGLLLRWKISRLLMKLGGLEAAAVVALAFGLLAASMAEACGLALIVGAYVMGLSLSETDIVNVIHKSLLPIRELLVPMLFCVTGMMANFEGIGSIIPFAILYTVLISAGKILGCGIPSLPFGFNVRGACRIGVGMVPRQEVGLIVAGIALTNGLIGSDIMGAIVIMVLVTAVATPPALSMLFRGGSGMRRPVDESGDSTSRLRIPLPAHDLAVLMAENLVETFRSEGFHVFDLPIRRKSWDLRRDSKVITISIDGDDIILVTGRDNLEYTRLAFMETLTRLRNVMSEFEAMGRESIRGLLYTPEDTGN
jgi:Kef-type K+ transport system membrane component KefB